MADRTPLGEVVEGYLGLGKWWFDSYGAHAQDVADRLAGGDYDADQAAADASHCLALGLVLAARAANELFEAVVVLAEFPGESGPAHAHVPRVSESLRGPDAQFELSLGDLMNPFEQWIAASDVSIHPRVLLNGGGDVVLTLKEGLRVPAGHYFTPLRRQRVGDPQIVDILPAFWVVVP